MGLRYYQREAIEGANDAWKRDQSTLLVMPTGTGKTHVFGHIAHEVNGRVMVVSHREELVFQAVAHLKAITLDDVDVEMADFKADLGGAGWFGNQETRKYISASVQTLNAGQGMGRMERFDPGEFGLLVIDECVPAGTMIGKRRIEDIEVGDFVPSYNHAASRIEYRRVLRLFRNPCTSLVRLRFGAHSIACTQNHPIFSDSGYVAARCISPGDGVYFHNCMEDAGIERVRVDSVEVLELGRGQGFEELCADHLVYNIEVEGNNNYFANGILAHNCHHTPADSYRAVLDHFRRNEKCKILGVTATPDRADEKALGQVFQSVAYDYEILDAINDGFLVPIMQQMVTVEGLDLSSVRTTAGDLNGADLAAILEQERNLHEVAGPTLDLCADARTLIFAASVMQAERLAEILNRSKPNSARFVCGKTPTEDRRKMLIAYARDEFQYLVNCAVATEGFDSPGIQNIVMARPTKSRALYSQMAGRGTRILAGLIDELTEKAEAEERKRIIAASAKPSMSIIDFVGNSGRHKLMSSADILGAGQYDDAIIERAAKNARETGKPMDMSEELERAKEQIEEEKRRAAARRHNLTAKAEYSTSTINPFDIFGVSPAPSRGWGAVDGPTEKQLQFLQKFGIPADGLNKRRASQLIGAQMQRWERNQCSFKQAALLKRYGIDASQMSRPDAKAMIDNLARNDWRMPKAEGVKVY